MSKPTRPTVPIVIEGMEYKLFFDYNAVADSEERLLSRGVEANLIAARWDPLTATTARALFLAGMKKHQPHLEEGDLLALYAEAAPSDVLIAIGKGYRNFIPEPDDKGDGEAKADPPPPVV